MAMTTWVLAFDAGCVACSRMAQRVQAVTGTAVQVRGLSEPAVRQWRERALGPAAPWAPTLLAVAGEQVRAWTGAALSVRLARLLGARRAVRVVRSLAEVQGAAEVGSGGAETGRRRLLLAIPGAAAAALVVTGGSGAAWASSGAAKGQVPISELAERVYGLDPSQINLVPEASQSGAAATRAARSPALAALAAPLRATGVEVLTPAAFTADIRLENGAVLPTLEVTRHPLRGRGLTGGEIILITGPAGTLALSIARHPDGSTELVGFDARNGVRGTIVVGADGQVLSGAAPDPVVLPAAVTCYTICTILCDAWWGLGLPGCITACAASGPADPICAALCGLIVAGVCNLFGCNVICCSCCGNC
jgi:hypothetical protein